MLKNLKANIYSSSSKWIFTPYPVSLSLLTQFRSLTTYPVLLFLPLPSFSLSFHSFTLCPFLLSYYLPSLTVPLLVHFHSVTPYTVPLSLLAQFSSVKPYSLTLSLLTQCHSATHGTQLLMTFP